jgi:hypothetical protein
MKGIEPFEVPQVFEHSIACLFLVEEETAELTEAAKQREILVVEAFCLSTVFIALADAKEEVHGDHIVEEVGTEPASEPGPAVVVGVW